MLCLQRPALKSPLAGYQVFAWSYAHCACACQFLEFGLHGMQ